MRETRILSRSGVVVGAIALASLLGACAPQIGENPDGIEYTRVEIDLYEEATVSASSRGPGNGKGPRIDDFEYRILQVARILPVTVDGETVQANDIVIAGDSAVIAYNTAGPTYNGAIQVVSIADPYAPVITAEIAFPDVEITTIEVDGSILAFGGSIHPDAAYTNERSFVATLDLTDLSSATLIEDTVESANTFAPDAGTYYFTTGIVKVGDNFYASVGADPGAVFELDADFIATPVVESGTDAENRVLDIRDIEAYHGGIIAIAGTNATGAPAMGRVLVFKDGAIHEDSVLEIVDFGSTDAKATIEVYGNHHAFLGLSEAGFQVLFLRDVADPSTGYVEPIFALANPTVGWSARSATNSASYSDDLVFTANGEAGFRVFRVSERLRPNTRPDGGWLDLVGFVPFDETLQDSGDYWSANHIEYRENTLIAAVGLGGVTIYRLEQR